MNIWFSSWSTILAFGKSINKMERPVFSFRGLIALPFTPFKGIRGAQVLNLAVIPEYAQYFAANGYKMLLINGTYGEGMTMTTDERMQVAEAWAKAVKLTGQGLFIHIGATNLQDVKRLAAHAQSINASALLCLPELYYKPRSVEDLIDYLKEVGACAPKVPLFYYHSPDATGVEIHLIEFFRKVGNQVPSLAGIKTASTKLDQTTRVIEAAGDRYRVITADSLNIAASISIGADTVMPILMNIAPVLCHDIYNAAMAGDYVTAQAYQRKLANVIEKIMAIDKSTVPVIKAVVRRLLLPKIDIGTTRKPLRDYDLVVEEAKLVPAILAELKSAKL